MGSLYETYSDTRTYSNISDTEYSNLIFRTVPALHYRSAFGRSTVPRHMSYANCGPKFMKVWDDVGNPLKFITSLPDCMCRR